MRVLHINVNYITSALHQTMIEHLNDIEGLENSVFVPTYDKSRSVVTCKDYVTLTECYKKWDRILYFKKQNKIINAILDNYEISNFDIIHAYTLFTDGNAAMELSKKYDIPYVVAIRNTDVNDFFKKMIHLRMRGVRILENASAVFFLSPVYRDTVIHKYVPARLRQSIRAKSYIIPNGIDDFWHINSVKRDTSTIVERIRQKKLIRFIYVGGIDKNKNVELTLKALSQLNDQGWNCTLTAVGKIVDKAIFERLCSYSCFKYIAPKKKEELLDYYRTADIFIMPSHTETFGLVYAEAMSQGLPVIYTKGQGFDGQFAEGTIGYHVDARNVYQCKEAILKIINNYPAFSTCSSNRSSIFQWSRICNQYVSIYNDLLNEGD